MARNQLFVRKLLIALLVVSLLAQPVGAAAAPLPMLNGESLETLIAPGLEYLDSFGETLETAGDLISRLGALSSASPTQPTIGELTVARDDLSTLAMQSAESIGSIESMVEALSRVTDLTGPAVDTQQIGATGIPGEIQDGLINQLGFTSSQVSQINQAFQDELQDRSLIQTQGLPLELENFLLEAGYSVEDIQEIETSIITHGVMQAGLSTRAEQLLASRDDLASLRAGAHILYVQLIGTEIAVHQRAGEPARTLTEGELEEIAKDELRLLIHTAHIQSQLEQGETDVGEGVYWFIERYAGRAAQRLESLLIETQNYGLAVELFILLELRAIAAEARFGGLQFAGQELAHYAGILAEIINAQAFFAHHREDGSYLFATFSGIPLVYKYYTWALAEEDVQYVAKLARSRFESHQKQQLIDDFPGNNSLEVLLAAGYSKIPYVANIWHLLVLPLSRQAIDLLSLFLGFRDPRNTEEMITLMVVSLVPILDILNDLITFTTNPSTFVKVIALVGIFLSLGEITTFIPGANILGPPAIVADTMSTGVRAVYTTYGDATAKAILDKLDDPDAILWVTDLMRASGRRLVAEGIDLSEEGVPAVTRLLSETTLFDDYLSYVHVAKNLELIQEGVDEGGIFIGRISRQIDAIESPIDINLHRQLKAWGNELFEQGIDISDEAAGGIARVASELGSESVERLRLGLQHANGEFIEEEIEFALDLIRRAGFDWTDEALEGVGLSTRLIGRNVTEQIFDLEFGSAEAFSIISLKPAGLWNETTGQGLARYFSHSFDSDVVRLPTPLETYYFDSISSYPDHVVEDVLRLYGSGDPQVPTHILNRLDDPRDLLQWVEKGNQLTVLEDLKNQGLIRRDIIEEELQEFWHEMLEFWNEGAQMEGRQLAEAVGVELPLYRLKQMGYEVIWVNPPGFQGPDAFLWNTILNKPVIFEGKGTLQSVTNLTGSYFPNTIFGRQLSRDWITNGADRYLRHIADEDVLRQVENILDQIRSGEPYEVIVGRGALNAEILDSGSGLGNFIKAIDPGERNPGWSFLFIFVNRP